MSRIESEKLKKTLGLTIICSIFFVSQLHADENAKAFLENLDGNFRGQGEAVTELSNRQERVSCRVENKLNTESSVLQISGVCATTQGKANVSGKLEIVNGKVVGSFISPFKDSQITQSSSNFQNGKLILSSSLINKSTGSLSRTRQIVQRGKEGGFNSTFQRFDNASGDYKNTGYVEFTPVGE